MKKIKRPSLKADLLLLLTAAIWGLAFVAQRAGMEHIGPFYFNGIRFALGAATVIPLAFRKRRNTLCDVEGKRKLTVSKGLIAGSVLFAGASLQQIGLVYTSAGNAGFVTGLYIVIVPLIGLFKHRSIRNRTWTSVLLAVTGMFLLSTSGSSRMATGDIVVFGGAIFWAFHIHLISEYVKRIEALLLAAIQFIVCSVLSLITALLIEKISLTSLKMAAIPILYGGFISVGIAYTLQIIAQKKTIPSRAAIVMSFEAVFALIGGWLMLGEKVTLLGIFGCLLMLTAIILSGIGKSREREIPI